MYYERDKALIATREPMLQKLCETYDFDMILIDGNEYTGWGEYVILSLYCKPRYLALHDAASLKTRRIEEELSQKDAPYKLLYSGKDGASWLLYELRGS